MILAANDFVASTSTRLRESTFRTQCLLATIERSDFFTARTIGVSARVALGDKLAIIARLCEALSFAFEE